MENSSFFFNMNSKISSYWIFVQSCLQFYVNYLRTVLYFIFIQVSKTSNHKNRIQCSVQNLILCQIYLINFHPEKGAWQPLYNAPKLPGSINPNLHGGHNHHPMSENYDNRTEQPIDLRLVCKFKFVPCGPVEIK